MKHHTPSTQNPIPPVTDTTSEVTQNVLQDEEVLDVGNSQQESDEIEGDILPGELITSNNSEQSSEIIPVVETEEEPPYIPPEEDIVDVPSDVEERVAVDNTPVVTVRNPSNFRQEFEISSLIDPKLKNKDPMIALPTDTQANTKARLEALPNIDLTTTPEGERWNEIRKLSRTAVPEDDWLTSITERDNTELVQGVKSDKGGTLRAGIPRYDDKVATNLVGESALMRVNALLYPGSVIQIPLWRSGFWITLKQPSDSALLELNRRLAEEKITLGRHTYGLVFSNMSVVFTGWLIDFVLQHELQTTLQPEALNPNGKLADGKPNPTNGDLRNLISSYDIPSLIWGICCVIWPAGFVYARSIIDQTDAQVKVIEETLNLTKLQIVDNRALNDWQKNHMADRFGKKMSIDSVLKYQAEFTRGQGKCVDLTEKVKMTLKSPTVMEYLVSGQRWINGIVTMVDRAFDVSDNPSIRDDYILDQGKASNMRQFGHFIDNIIVSDQQLYQDTETIETLLDSFTKDDEVNEAYFTAIKNFIEDSTIAVIAIPVTEPEDKSPFPRFPHLLPLDVGAVFFTLLVQKVTQIQNRR